MDLVIGFLIGCCCIAIFIIYYTFWVFFTEGSKFEKQQEEKRKYDYE